MFFVTRSGFIPAIILLTMSISTNAQTTAADLHYLVRQPTIASAKPPVLIMLHGVGSNEQDLKPPRGLRFGTLRSSDYPSTTPPPQVTTPLYQFQLKWMCQSGCSCPASPSDTETAFACPRRTAIK